MGRTDRVTADISGDDMADFHSSEDKRAEEADKKAEEAYKKFAEFAGVTRI